MRGLAREPNRPRRHPGLELDQIPRCELCRFPFPGGKRDSLAFKPQDFGALQNTRQEVLEAARIVDIAVQHLGHITLVEHAHFAGDKI